MANIITNTRGQTVATLQDSTVDVTTPLTMIGRGYSGYTKALNEDLYRLMENFASDSAPSTPAQGMLWYAPTANSISYYSGTGWVEIMTAASNSGALLSRMGGASNINFASTGTANLHTGAVGLKTIITGVLLIPQAGASVVSTTTIPMFSLEIGANTGDVCDPVVLKGLTGPTKFYFHHISGSNRIVSGNDVVKINKRKAIDGGDTLVVDAYLFGNVRS